MMSAEKIYILNQPIYYIKGARRRLVSYCRDCGTKGIPLAQLSWCRQQQHKLVLYESTVTRHLNQLIHKSRTMCSAFKKLTRHSSSSISPYELKAIFLVWLTKVLSLKILSTSDTYLPNEIVISYLL